MLSSWKAPASVAFATAKSLLNKTPNLVSQQARTTYVLKRQQPMRLHKKGVQPRKMNHNCFYYDIDHNTLLTSPPPLDIILTQFVEGVGEKGDKISMRPHKAYNHFLLPGLAVYASPENIDKFLNKATKQEKTFSSLHAAVVLKYLQKCTVVVKMSIENPWVIEKWHIRASFRTRGIHVTDEAITLPDHEIKGPNLDNEGKEFYVTITINKTEKTPVRCKLHHDTFDLSKQLPPVENFWYLPGEPLFPEDEEVLNTIPKPKLETGEEVDDE